MSDYPGFNELNHIILQVPLPTDTLWLECTNTLVPFGFAHNGISGHDAIEVSENGGRFCKVKDYPDSLNMDNNKSFIVLYSDGSAKVTSKKEYKVKEYNYNFIRLKPAEQTDRMRKLIELPNATVEKLFVKEDKSVLPSLTVDYEWTTYSYGNKSGNRLFIPVNPLRKVYSQFQKTNRTNDIDISSGFYNIDSLYVVIPEGFEIESLPPENIEESPYGNFKSQIITDENGFLIIQSFYLQSGYYKVEEYDSIRKFFEKINSGYNGKIALRKMN